MRQEQIDKRERLRRFHRQRREEMSAEEVQKLSRAICERVYASDWYTGCRVLYAYYPLGREADCRPLIERALAEGKCVALPRTAEESRMDFFRITSLRQVAEGKFHVMEPVAGRPIVQGRAGLALVPGLVFGADGGRYGYGKGYYDHYFARFPGLLRAALAFEHQMEAELETAENDIAMQRIYTEKTVYLPRKERDRK